MSTTHECKVRLPYYSSIKEGIKLYEGRINDAKWSQVKKGDQLRIIVDLDKGYDPITKTVKNVWWFANWELALEQIPVENVMPGCTKEECVENYNNLPFKAESKALIGMEKDYTGMGGVVFFQFD
jgi:ASC-1-like (ASCH) protein